MPIRRGHARVLFNEGAFAEDTMRSGRIYLPPPAGKFGMVLRFIRDSEGLALRYLAFGVRHHPRSSNAPTVYDIAHRRLHE